MSKKTNLMAGLAPVHPGAFLREDVLPHVKMSKRDLAEALGVSRAQLYAILGEHAPVTAVMALRLGKLFGNGPDLWLNMQSRFDFETLGARMKKELASIPTVEAA